MIEKLKPSSWNDSDRKEVYDIILNNLEINEGDHVLDDGCGLGRFLNTINTDVTKTGIDIDQRYLDHCKTTYPDTRFELADACDLPYPDDSFDVLTSICVIEHVDNPVALIKEAYRVCRPRARAVFVTPNLGRPLRFNAALMKRRRVEPDHNQGWDYNMYRHFLESAGWHVEKVLTRFVDCPFYKWLPRRLGRWMSYKFLLKWFPWLGSELFAFCRKESP